MFVDTPDLCAARREALLRELDAYDATQLRRQPVGRHDGLRDEGGRPRGRRVAPGPKPPPARPARPVQPPDLVVEIRATVAGVQIVDRATGRDVVVRSRADLAAAVVDLLAAARRAAAPPA
jgi:hypothetical protein